MSHYLMQLSFTHEAWATLVKNPQNRAEAIRPAVEKLGGSIVGAWYAFGEYDIVLVCQFPNNVSAAALAITFSAGGAVKAVKTTPLMTTEEGMEAMRKATGTGYQPPSG